ncbi:MAG TPA: DUF4920 domain-containing protein, partial [Planctomycetota bacterium]
MTSPRPIAPVCLFAAASVLATSLWAQTPAPPAPAGNPAPANAAQEPAAAKKAAKLDEKLYDHFGDGIAEGPAVEVADAMKTPDQYTGKTVRFTGPISGVCQTKGCWMQLGSQNPIVFVKFKDYAFFVPKDASGRVAIVEGTMTMKQETVEQTKHYLEDAGKHE